MTLPAFLVINSLFQSTALKRSSFNVTLSSQDGASSTGGRFCVARVVSTVQSHAFFEDVTSFFVQTRRAPQSIEGTRNETGCTRKTEEARNNHPIIKSLTSFRFLLSVIYLSPCSAIFDVNEKDFFVISWYFKRTLSWEKELFFFVTY